jgi:hypothetical protein
MHHADHIMSIQLSQIARYALVEFIAYDEFKCYE